MHAMKQTDLGFCGYGEAYFSWIKYKVVKAWKYHKDMTMNLIVPSGEVRFVFHDESTGIQRIEIIGASNYVRLTVPPKVWFGFQGLSRHKSLLLNIANVAHCPEESLRKDLSQIPFDWFEKKESE